MIVKPVSEKKHFLNEEQKAVKQKIMETLINGLYDNLRESESLFDLQSGLDLIFSILIMFNRDVLINLMTNAGISNKRNAIMKSMFDTIRHEVNTKINKAMN